MLAWCKIQTIDGLIVLFLWINLLYFNYVKTHVSYLMLYTKNFLRELTRVTDDR